MTEHELESEFGTTQPNGFDEPPKSSNTEMNKFVKQQSSTTQHFNNSTQTPHRQQTNNYQRNYNNQKQIQLNQSNISRQVIYNSQIRKVTITQKL